MLVPQCNQNALQHLLNDPDIGHSVGEDMVKEEDVPVPVDIHASREQAAEEYELFRQYLASNDYLDIYCHFRQHMVFMREGNVYPYDPLPFPGVNDDDMDFIHH